LNNRLSVAFTVIIIVATNSTAQPQVDLFQLYSDGLPSESFGDLYQRTGGGYYLAGRSGQRPWLLHVNEEGNVVWSELNGSGDFKSVIEADNGDVAAGGILNGNFSAARYNARNGQRIWSSEFGNGNCSAILELKEGGFVLVGSIFEAERWQGCIVRINDQGEPIWNRRYTNNINDSGQFHLRTARETENGVVAGGDFDPVGPDYPQGWVIKIDFNGELQWTRLYASNMAKSFNSMVSCPGGFVLSGVNQVREEGDRNPQPYKFCLTFINGNGEVQSDHVYTLVQGGNYMGAGAGLCRLADGGFCSVGFKQVYGNRSTSIPIAIRTDENGELLWSNDFSVQREERNLTMYSNGLNSVICVGGTTLIACGIYESRDVDQDFDGLLSRFEPDILGPVIFYRFPEDSLLTILPDSSIRFIVRSRNQQGNEAAYNWFQGDSLLGRDTTVTYQFLTSGDYSIRCHVDAGGWEAETGWLVHVRDLFIAFHSPDTLSLSLRRGTTQTFFLDSVAAVEGDAVNYQWTLTDLNSFEAEDAGGDTSATVDFLRSGNFQLEGLAYRGESSDNVVWTIAVRSAILDFWPRDLDLTVLPDSAVDFGVLPFDPESDSLSYEWLVDGELAGQDSTLRWWFAPGDSTGDFSRRYVVSAIVLDGSDGDTVAWTVSVRVPDEVSKSESPKVEKFELLSAYPNPFNSTTTIRFTVPSSSSTSLTLHDLSGRQVRECVSAQLHAGEHSYILNGDDLPAGIYLIRLKTGNFTKVKKVVLVK